MCSGPTCAPCPQPAHPSARSTPRRTHAQDEYRGESTRPHSAIEAAGSPTQAVVQDHVRQTRESLADDLVHSWRGTFDDHRDVHVRILAAQRLSRERCHLGVTIAPRADDYITGLKASAHRRLWSWAMVIFCSRRSPLRIRATDDRRAA